MLVAGVHSLRYDELAGMQGNQQSCSCLAHTSAALIPPPDQQLHQLLGLGAAAVTVHTGDDAAGRAPGIEGACERGD